MRQDNQPPFVDRLSIPSHEDLYLFHHPRVRAHAPPTVFERYVFKFNVWSPVPWDISPIEIGPDDDIIFVRILDVHCRGFGNQLHDYQIEHGHALAPEQRLAHVIYDPPKCHRWVLVWDQV